MTLQRPNFLQNHPTVLVLSGLGAIASIVGIALYLRDASTSTRVGTVKAEAGAERLNISTGSIRINIHDHQGVVFTDGPDPLLRVRLAEGRLLVSARILDPSGTLLAELIENEWTVNANTAFDRNYSETALEVRDSEGNIALQVVAFVDTIHVAGIFRCRDGGSTQIVPDGLNGAIWLFSPSREKEILSIDPICRYPSETNLGDCPGVNSIERLVHTVTYRPACVFCRRVTGQGRSTSAPRPTNTAPSDVGLETSSVELVVKHLPQ